ncbi:hypothetical protein DYB26_002292, partial [Aphanomyces astaci]
YVLTAAMYSRGVIFLRPFVDSKLRWVAVLRAIYRNHDTTSQKELLVRDSL